MKRQFILMLNSYTLVEGEQLQLKELTQEILGIFDNQDDLAIFKNRYECLLKNEELNIIDDFKWNVEKDMLSKDFLKYINDLYEKSKHKQFYAFSYCEANHFNYGEFHFSKPYKYSNLPHLPVGEIK